MWHNYSWLLKDSQNENSYLMSLPSFNVTTDSDESLECLLKKINPWTKSEDTTNTGSTNRESDQLIFIGVDKSNRKTAAGHSRVSFIQCFQLTWKTQRRLRVSVPLHNSTCGRSSPAPQMCPSTLTQTLLFCAASLNAVKSALQFYLCISN